MNIEIIEGEGKGDVMPLEEFLAVNEFEDDYAAEIREALDRNGEYSDGGGAAPLWTVRVVDGSRCGVRQIKKFHFNVYVPATDQNPTARSEYEMLIKAALPDAEVVFVETFDPDSDSDREVYASRGSDNCEGQSK